MKERDILLVFYIVSGSLNALPLKNREIDDALEPLCKSNLLYLFIV